LQNTQTQAQNNTQIHTQKLNFFYFKLSSSEFARDLQNTQTQAQNSNTQRNDKYQTQTFEYF
jgi:hypothetical protein